MLSINGTDMKIFYIVNNLCVLLKTNISGWLINI